MSLTTNTLRMYTILCKTLGIARPAGNGIVGNPYHWDSLYTCGLPYGNAHYMKPFQKVHGVPFRADGLIKDSPVQDVAALNGNGGAFDLLLNAGTDTPVFCECKVGRQRFNGNDGFDLWTGLPSYVDSLEQAVLDSDLSDVILLIAFEQRLPSGYSGLFMECFNLSAFFEADEDAQFTYNPIYRKTSTRRYKRKDKNPSSPTYGQKIQIIKKYKTLRMKPSLVRKHKKSKSNSGRQATNTQTKCLLKEMGIMSEPVYLARFDGTTDKVVAVPAQVQAMIQTIL